MADNDKKITPSEPIAITPMLGIEAESKILSALLNNCPNGNEAFNKLLISDFNEEAYRLVFGSMLRLFNANKKLDPVAIIDSLVSQTLMSPFEAQQLIANLTSVSTSFSSLDIYIEIVKMASILKALKNLGTELQDIKVDFLDFDDTITKFENQFLQITKSKIGSDIKTIKGFVSDYREKLKRAFTEQLITGTKTGYEAIDKITNGFQPGDLIILAARPGKGKTAFAINLLINAAKNLGENEAVAMFSLEMGGDQIIHRMTACESMVNFNLTNARFLSAEDGSSVSYGLNEIAELPILIDDSSDLTISEIQSLLKQAANTYKLKLVVIDYLQLVKATKNSIGMNRQQEVTLISHSFKSLARELNVPILAIAQLSRKIEERRGPDSQPILSDLRESGSIEQDADLVCFLNTPSGDGDDQNDLNNQNPDVEFIIAKHRNGPTGKVLLSFMKHIGKFTSKNYNSESLDNIQNEK